MNEHVNSKLSKYLRRVAIAIVASGTVAAPAVYAKPFNNLVVVAPTELPELARRAGEAMLLRETVDGRALLYIEQNQGTRMAILDVTDPSHVKAEGSVQLDVSGAFDFVSTLGGRAELVRFRQGQGDAVLDLQKAEAPTLARVQGQTLQGSIMLLGDDGFTVTRQADVPPARNYPVVDTAVVDTTNLPDLVGIFDVKRVREEVANDVTGTIFLLTEDGLYLIRRPGVEMVKKFRELAYAN